MIHIRSSSGEGLNRMFTACASCGHLVQTQMMHVYGGEMISPDIYTARFRVCAGCQVGGFTGWNISQEDMQQIRDASMQEYSLIGGTCYFQDGVDDGG